MNVTTLQKPVFAMATVAIRKEILFVSVLLATEAMLMSQVDAKVPQCKPNP
jgi:hypothetical protein